MTYRCVEDLVACAQDIQAHYEQNSAGFACFAKLHEHRKSCSEEFEIVVSVLSARQRLLLELVNALLFVPHSQDGIRKSQYLYQALANFVQMIGWCCASVNARGHGHQAVRKSRVV